MGRMEHNVAALARGVLVAASLALTVALPSSLVPGVASAQAPAKKVALHILVIEASKEGSIEKSLEPLAKNMPGYKGARLQDELNATVEEGSSVSLEVLAKAGTPRLMKVTVRKIEDQKEPKEIKLRVAIDAIKLSVDPTYRNGGTFLIHHPVAGDKDKALFLAITPKL